MRVLYQEEGPFPEVYASYLISPCYHCVEPVCTFVCPNEAISKRESDGIVLVDKDKCREEKTCGIISEEKMGADFSYGESQSPCQTACPVHLDIPAYIALIAKGKYKESLDLIRRKMPLPSVCGRVCLHPCESACSRQEVDQAIAIEALKGFVSDFAPQAPPEQIPQTFKDKVAIVGSGPAGLAAAYDLIRLGYGVTIFEALPVAGGMLSVGIPKYRLPSDVLNRDIDYIKALGVEIKTDSSIDIEKGLSDLLDQGYSAVLLAIGAHKGQKLNIPGTDLDGTWVGTSFMRDVNLGKDVNIGKKVLVIGGGNVAMDCARAARRLGAEEVGVSCLECCDDMPADISEVEQAREEGIEIYDECTFQRVIGDDGKVTGVGYLKIAECYFDEDNQPHFEIVDENEEILSADTVIFAVGQTPDVNDKGHIKLNKSGTIIADSETHLLDDKGIFVAGDCFTGEPSIIDAIANGQKAGGNIHRFIQGDVLRIKEQPLVDVSEIKIDIPPGTEKQDREPMPRLPVEERVSSFKEVNKGFSEEAAIKEAKRCLNCAGHLCKDVCPYQAPQFVKEVKAKMEKCNYCVDRIDDGKIPVCVEACMTRAIDSGTMEDLTKKYGDIKETTGFVFSKPVQPAVVFKPKPK